MNAPSSQASDPTRDEIHLSLLSIGHVVLGSLMVLMAPCGVLALVLLGPLRKMQADLSGSGQAEQLDPMSWFLLAWAVVLLALGAANIVSGILLRRRRGRGFSLVVAAIDCIQVPLGTALGIGTIIVLARPSVWQSYGGSPRARNPE